MAITISTGIEIGQKSGNSRHNRHRNAIQKEIQHRRLRHLFVQSFIVFMVDNSMHCTNPVIV
jgi:hypothetical protein